MLPSLCCSYSWFGALTFWVCLNISTGACWHTFVTLDCSLKSMTRTWLSEKRLIVVLGFVILAQKTHPLLVSSQSHRLHRVVFGRIYLTLSRQRAQESKLSMKVAESGDICCWKVCFFSSYLIMLKWIRFRWFEMINILNSIPPSSSSTVGSLSGRDGDGEGPGWLAVGLRLWILSRTYNR